MSFALHTNWTGSGFKVYLFDPHTVGGLKQTEVDSMGGVGLKCPFSDCVKLSRATSCADQSNGKVKVLLGIWGLLRHKHLLQRFLSQHCRLSQFMGWIIHGGR